MGRRLRTKQGPLDLFIQRVNHVEVAKEGVQPDQYVEAGKVQDQGEHRAAPGGDGGEDGYVRRVPVRRNRVQSRGLYGWQVGLTGALR